MTNPFYSSYMGMEKPLHKEPQWKSFPTKAPSPGRYSVTECVGSITRSVTFQTLAEMIAYMVAINFMPYEAAAKMTAILGK